MSALESLRRLRASVEEVPFPGEPLRPPAARVPPGEGVAELGVRNALVTGAIRRATGGETVNVFATLARHRRAFRPWLRFAGRLMPFGTLPRRDAELVILRVAVLCGSDYEWVQHARLGQHAGLTPEEVARIGDHPESAPWSDRDRTLLRATDCLVHDHTIPDPLWSELALHLPEPQRIELCLLAGHYAMLAGTLNALGVEPER